MGLPDIPHGIKTLANAALASWDSTLSGMQDDYFSSHGHDFQVVVTGGIPAKGAHANPDASHKLSDQAESCTDLSISFPANAVIAVGCNVCVGPDGNGWAAFGEISIAGKVWRKEIGHGCKASHDWREVGDA